MEDRPMRTAIVTGGARGIGYEVCARFAEDGWSVIAVDRDPAVVTAHSDRSSVRGVELEVVDERAWQDLLDRIDPDTNPVAALVNCAGILGVENQVVDEPLEEWRRVIDINLTGTFVSCKAVVPRLRRQGAGWIVNLASISGKEGNAGQAAYSASKGGVIAFTKALAKEVAADGITVNAIAPTMVEGPLSASMSPELRRALLAKIPMGRLGQPREVAAMVSWICSDQCSFTTGFVFDLTGGRATY